MHNCSTGTVDMRLLNKTKLHLRSFCIRISSFDHADLPAEHQDTSSYELMQHGLTCFRRVLQDNKLPLNFDERIRQ